MKTTGRKKRLLLGGVILSFAFILATSFSSVKRRDCNPLILMEEAVKKLKKFTMVKDYAFSFNKQKKGKVETMDQIVTLSSGVRYKFLAVKNNDFEGNPVVAIYNNQKKEFLVASSYSSSTKQFYDEIEFECRTTGNYCLSFYFFNGEEGCAVGVHAFLK